MGVLWGIWSLSFFLFHQNEILHTMSCLTFNIFLSFNPSKCLFIDWMQPFFHECVLSCYYWTKPFFSCLWGRGTYFFRAKVREPLYCSFCGDVFDFFFFFFLLTANHVWFLGIFQPSRPLNLFNLSIFLPSCFPCAAHSFPCFLPALCPLTLAHLGLRPLQLVGAHHGL